MKIYELMIGIVIGTMLTMGIIHIADKLTERFAIEMAESYCDDIYDEYHINMDYEVQKIDTWSYMITMRPTNKVADYFVSVDPVTVDLMSIITE